MCSGNVSETEFSVSRSADSNIKGELATSAFWSVKGQLQTKLSP